MNTPRYRMMVSFDTEQQVFRARAYELEHCFGEGPTRAEAIAQLEQEILAQVQNLQEQGKQPPKAIDEQVWTGEIAVQVSRSLHRDLAWQARLEGTELSQLLIELLASGLENRRAQGRGARSQGRDGNRISGESSNGNSARDWGHNRSNYSGLMDDRAQFIQYVRNADGEQRHARHDKNKQSRQGPERRPHKRHHRRHHNGPSESNLRTEQASVETNISSPQPSAPEVNVAPSSET